MFKKKAEIDELPGDSTDIFQHDILDHYLDRPNEILRMVNIKLLINFVLQSFYHYIMLMLSKLKFLKMTLSQWF